MKQIRADEKGIVRLKYIAPLRACIGTQDRPGEQHADRLSADEPGAYQPFLDFEKIAKLEVKPRQAENALIAPNQQSAQLLHHHLTFIVVRGGSEEICGPEEQSFPGVQVALHIAGHSATQAVEQAGCFTTHGDRVEFPVT